jgi:hypothetical protein
MLNDAQSRCLCERGAAAAFPQERRRGGVPARDPPPKTAVYSYMKVIVPNEGGIKQGDNPAPKYFAQSRKQSSKFKMRNILLFSLNFDVTLCRRGIEQGASPELAARMSAIFLSFSSSVFMQMT